MSLMHFDRTLNNDEKLVLKLLIALGAGEQDVHPDPHGLGGGGHEVILPVLGLHAKCHSLGNGL